MKKQLFIMLLVFSSLTAFTQIKISQMPTLSGNPITGYLPIVKNGINYKLSIDSLQKYLYTANLPLTIDTGVFNFPQADINNNGFLSAADFTTFSNSVSRWNLSGTDIYSNNTGNVGIGTISPTKKLTVNGDALISGITVGIGGTGSNPRNVAIGTDALVNSTATTQGNTVIGYLAASTMTTGLANVAIGYVAMQNSTASGGSVAIGNAAMQNHTGSALYNTAIGYNVMNTAATGASNVAIGRSAMTNVSGTLTGSNNVAIGSSSGSITDGSNNVVLGGGISQVDPTASNILTIGSAGVTWITGISGDIGIGTTSPTTKLDINNNKFRVRTAKTPSSATDTGNEGDICWDANYVYVCIATNTWKRSPLTTW